MSTKSAYRMDRWVTNSQQWYNVQNKELEKNINKNKTIFTKIYTETQTNKKEH